LGTSRSFPAQVNDIASGVKDHPDKIEFMEETLEVLKKTLRAEAAMRDELKVSLSSMSERQDAFVNVQRELNQVLQKTENQEKFIKNLELKQNEIAEEYAEDRMTIVAVKEAVQEVGVEVRETQRDVKTNSEAVEKTFGTVKRETMILQKHQKKLETIVNDDDPTSGPGREKSAKCPTSKAPLSAVFHSFRLIFGRAIISRSALEAWVLFPERARAEHSR